MSFPSCFQSESSLHTKSSDQTDFTVLSSTDARINDCPYGYHAILNTSGRQGRPQRRPIIITTPTALGWDVELPESILRSKRTNLVLTLMQDTLRNLQYEKGTCTWSAVEEREEYVQPLVCKLSS